VQLLHLHAEGLPPPDRAARPLPLLTGEAELASYRFGTMTAHHLFCRHCGVASFYVPRSHPIAST